MDIYQTASSARDGMTGTLNMSVLLDIAKSKGLTEFDDLLEFVNEIESELTKKRSEDKPKT